MTHKGFQTLLLIKVIRPVPPKTLLKRVSGPHKYAVTCHNNWLLPLNSLISHLYTGKRQLTLINTVTAVAAIPFIKFARIYPFYIKSIQAHGWQ
jgi:hypothetical protein